jgi:hypothetical protein
VDTLLAGGVLMLLTSSAEALLRRRGGGAAMVDSNVVGLGSSIIHDGHGRDHKGVVPLQKKRGMSGGNQSKGVGG